MKTSRLSLVVSVVALFTASSSIGQWVNWPVTSGGNGHWYLPVSTSSLVSWREANAAARNSGGYLATITSAQENDFVFGLIGSPQYWNGAHGPLLGGYQPPGSAEPAGGWTWVTGESWGYANWAGGQPDNGGEQEDGIHFWGGSQWNDKSTNHQFFVSYVIEHDNGPLNFDASRDYSTQANPNGVWSYGWKANVNGPFSLLTYNHASSFGDGTPAQFWSLAHGVAPATGYNPSTNTAVQDGGQGVFPPGTLWLAAGVDGSPENFGVVRFTVPSQGSGEYLLQSTVRPYLDGNLSGDVDYHVVVNGSEVFGVFLPPITGTNYSNTFRLSTGDTVDFMVGRGADGRLYGSALKLQATLTRQISCIPRKATATAQLVNGFVVGATITDDGCGYTNAPVILIQGGGGNGATARAVITDGRVTAIIITDAGIGYETPPRIVIASPPFVPSLSIAVSRVKLVQNVVLARKYVLESSHDARSWSEALPSFTATSESITNEFDVDVTGRFFRVREIP